jgi:hypothetical protein
LAEGPVEILQVFFGLIVSKYLSSIWVQPKTPLLRQEAPHIPSDAPDVAQEVPDNLQDTSDDPQKDVNDRQGDCQVRQVDIKMAKYSCRDLPFDKEANAHLLDHFCRRCSEKDPTKPGKMALFQLLLKYMVASGDLIIDRFEEGVPILSREEGNAQVMSHHVMSRRPVTLQAPAPRCSRPRRRRN